jgi:hypothetical protein
LAKPQTMSYGVTFGQLAFLWEYYGILNRINIHTNTHFKTNAVEES